MNCHTNHFAAPPIQLLVPLCRTVAVTDGDMIWLQGYCLVTIRIGDGPQLDATIGLGQPYGANPALIRGLAFALHSGAVLAGYDCHDLIGKLGRLPIEVNDPKPAIHLLSKLKCMLGFRNPIDLAIDDNSQTEVAIQRLRLPPGMDQETREALEDELFKSGFSDETSVRPHRLAADLIDSARAYVGAIPARYFTDEMQSAVVAAWDDWELSVQPQIAALALRHEIGGEPIRIT